jgi:hypothetical protein
MSSPANLTAAMIEAHMATVLAYRALCSFSQAICRFISPMTNQHRRRKREMSIAQPLSMDGNSVGKRAQT